MLAVLVLQPLLHPLQAGDDAGGHGQRVAGVRGIAPWAMTPVRSTRSRTAPLATAQISPSSARRR